MIKEEEQEPKRFDQENDKAFVVESLETSGRNQSVSQSNTMASKQASSSSFSC